MPLLSLGLEDIVSNLALLASGDLLADDVRRSVEAERFSCDLEPALSSGRISCARSALCQHAGM